MPRCAPVAARLPPTGHTIRQIVAQDDCTVMKGIVSAVEQCDVSAFAGRNDRLPRNGVGAELSPIPAAKLRPSLHPMIKPLAQRRTRRCFLQPCISGEILFPHSARPEALNENSTAIAARRWVVRSFDLNHHSCGVRPIRSMHDDSRVGATSRAALRSSSDDTYRRTKNLPSFARSASMISRRR
jgi:hypothetical protein